MKLREVEDALYDMTARFFVGAAVRWAEQIDTKPPLPYVILKVGNVQRNAFPLTDEDGKRYYQCSTKAEINLYTRGEKISAEENMTVNYANTAVSDLMDFFAYMDSEGNTDWTVGKGLAVSLIPPVRDLAALENDSQYRYRAMAEMDISFFQEADGYYGLYGTDVPNYSGGGTAELADEELSPIEEVEIDDETEEVNDNEK